MKAATASILGYWKLALMEPPHATWVRLGGGEPSGEPTRRKIDTIRKHHTRNIGLSMIVVSRCSSGVNQNGLWDATGDVGEPS